MGGGNNCIYMEWSLGVPCLPPLRSYHLMTSYALSTCLKASSSGLSLPEDTICQKY